MMFPISARLLRAALILLCGLVLSACSTVNTEKIRAKTDQTIDAISTKTNIGKNPRDPLEGFNRLMFNFNDSVDQNVLQPVARVYRDTTPGFFQTAVSNFFGNIGDVWSAVNNILQGKVGDGMSDVMRVAVNSTFGLGGMIDIASPAGLQKHKEDFGQTLGVWGVPSGPYIVLPMLGSSTLRDTAAMPVDMKADLWSYKEPVYIRNSGTVLKLVDKRASVLDAGTLLEEAALDKYVFIRDAYLQKRANDIRKQEDE